MRERKQSITIVSFQGDQKPKRGYFERKESPQAKTGQSAPAGSKPEGSMMKLCDEIAGALIRRYLTVGDPAAVRAEIREGLAAKLDCDKQRADRLIDLAIEMIHVRCYGRYRRNPLELGLLISKAAGHLVDVSSN